MARCHSQYIYLFKYNPQYTFNEKVVAFLGSDAYVYAHRCRFSPRDIFLSKQVVFYLFFVDTCFFVDHMLFICAPRHFFQIKLFVYVVSR